MTDQLAGEPVPAMPPTVADTQDDSFTATNGTYGVGSTGGSYADCGVAFLAPSTGRVLVSWTAWLENNTITTPTLLSFVLRTGATVGSGTTVVAASDSRSILQEGAATDRDTPSQTRLVEGLTPGDPYNVRLEHRVSGGTGQYQRRHVIVMPAP